MGGSPGLVVMGEGSCSEGRGFQSRCRLQDGYLDIFSRWFVVKIDRKNKKEAGVGPFFKKKFDYHQKHQSLRQCLMRFRTYSCLYEYFLNWPIPASFCLFSSFTREASVYDVLGTRTRGGRWKAQTNPLSYGGIPIFNVWFMPLVVVYVVKFKEDFTLASFSHQELNWGNELWLSW